MKDQINSQEWAQLRTSIGDAAPVPSTIARLLHAQSAEEADGFYWELDNCVVVQGQLYDSAPPTAHALVQAICEHDFTAPGLPWCLDLLVELAYGESDVSEVERGNHDLGERCRAETRAGLPCIKALIDREDDQVLLGVLDLVDRVESDLAAREAFFGALPLPGWSERLRSRIDEIQRKEAYSRGEEV